MSKIEEYDIKKIILFFGGCLVIIAGIIIAITLILGRKRYIRVSENLTSEEITTEETTMEYVDQTYDEEKCLERITQKCHVDIQSSIKDCYGIQPQDNVWYITAEITNESDLMTIFNDKFGEESSIEDYTINQADNSIIKTMNKQDIKHRWFVYGDPMPGAQGYEVYEVYITESDNGKKYLYVII